METAPQRIHRELQDLCKNPQQDFKIEMERDSWNELKGTFVGPPNTPYEGGTFEVQIRISEQYPVKAPQVKFINKVWHPNISSRYGSICLSILKDFVWNSTMSLKFVIMCLQELLAKPNAEDPLDYNAGRQMKTAEHVFNMTAEHWTGIFAKGPKKNPNFIAVTQDLVKMEVPEIEAIENLSRFNWSLEDTVNDYINTHF